MAGKMRLFFVAGIAGLACLSAQVSAAAAHAPQGKTDCPRARAAAQKNAQAAEPARRPTIVPSIDAPGSWSIFAFARSSSAFVP